MRVLYWTESCPSKLGGVAAFSGRLLEALLRQGVEVALVTRSDLNLPEAHNGLAQLPRLDLPFGQALLRPDPLQIAALADRVRSFVKHFKPDLVHLTSPAYPSAFFLLRCLGDVPLLITLHNSMGEFCVQAGTQAYYLLQRSKRLLCVSKYVQSRLRELCAEVAPKSQVLYCGHPDLILGSERESDIAQVLVAGRLSPEKGFDVALKAWTLVQAQCPQARLQVAGDGPQRQNLQRLCPQADFLGCLPFSQLVERLRAAWLVLVPSREEALGLVCLEAGLLQKAVIASQVGGIPEVVMHERTGLLVPPEDSSALAGACLRLLGNGQERRRLAQAAQVHVRDNFGWQECVRQHLKVYTEVTK